MAGPIVCVDDPNLVLDPVAQDDAPVLRNLLELYAHDFSEHVPFDLKPSGRFEVKLSDDWWARDDHFPFFLRSDGKLVGFALARRGSRVTGASDVMDLAEFFVVRGARRKKLGGRVAHALFAAFPSAWHIRVRQTNLAAMKFWSRTLGEWAGRTVEPEAFTSAEKIEWYVFRIEARA